MAQGITQWMVINYEYRILDSCCWVADDYYPAGFDL